MNAPTRRCRRHPSCARLSPRVRSQFVDAAAEILKLKAEMEKCKKADEDQCDSPFFGWPYGFGPPSTTAVEQAE